MIIAILVDTIKYILKWFIIGLAIILTVVYLTGCASSVYVKIPIEDATKGDPLRGIILKTFSKDRAIILSFERQYQNTFNIAKNFNQYKQTDKTPTYDGFYVWIIKNIWYKDWWYEEIYPGSLQIIIDNRFNDLGYIEIKKNYELFEEIGNKRW